MRVAVTGGAGFIGDHLVNQLRSRDHSPIVIDRSTGIDVVADSRRLEDELEYCDAVIHLAGVLGTSELFDHPTQAIDVNIKGTAQVLRACQKFHLRYVGITMPDVWDNVYQVTKKAAKGLATAWHQNFDVPVAHVRAFNVFGPGQKVGSPQKIIPTFSAHALRGTPIPIWGDGRQLVDLIYVEDVASILVDALTSPGKDEVLDAGTKTSKSVIEVARLVWNHVRDFEPLRADFKPMRKGERVHTELAATGEGWEWLDYEPVFHEDDLYATVDSYRGKV